MQVFGLLLFLGGGAAGLVTIAIQEKLQIGALSASIVTSIAGTYLLVLPIPKNIRIFYFFGVLLAPALFFTCFYFLDIAREFGFRVPFFVETIISIVISTVISYSVIAISRLKK